MTRPHSTEELLWWAARLAVRTDGTDWERRFCTGIAARARRRGFRLTEKQERLLRRLVAERLEDVEVIDAGAA